MVPAIRGESHCSSVGRADRGRRVGSNPTSVTKQASNSTAECVFYEDEVRSSNLLRLNSVVLIRVPKTVKEGAKSRRLYEINCERCGAQCYRRSKVTKAFCTVLCANRMRSSHVKMNCDWCHAPLKRVLSKLKKVANKSGKVFCTRRCKQLAQSVDGVPGCQPSHYKDGRRYRPRALLNLGASCSRCFYSEITAMLDVDHIDNNRANNKLENLQVLCVWCHALKTRKVSDFNRHEMGSA